MLGRHGLLCRRARTGSQNASTRSPEGHGPCLNQHSPGVVSGSPGKACARLDTRAAGSTGSAGATNAAGAAGGCVPAALGLLLVARLLAAGVSRTRGGVGAVSGVEGLAGVDLVVVVGGELFNKEV